MQVYQGFAGYMEKVTPRDYVKAGADLLKYMKI